MKTEWSRKHNFCIECGTVEVKHHVRGLCRKCYYTKNKERIIEYRKQYRKENKECIAEYDRRHYRENKEYYARQSKQYHAENRKQITKRNKQSYIENREHKSECHRQWRENNPEKRRTSIQNYQARKQNAEGTHTSEDIKSLFALANYQCQRCEAMEYLEIDHIVPLSKGGRNDITNLQVLCRSCNSSKGNRYSIDYRSGDYEGEWKCIDLNCTHWDGDRCTLGFCEPDIIDESEFQTRRLNKLHEWAISLPNNGGLSEE